MPNTDSSIINLLLQGLLLLLLLAYASGTCSHSGGTQLGPPPMQHHPHHQVPIVNHLRRQLRPQRELSEFLVPPPMPLNFRGPRGPPPPPPRPRVPPARVPAQRTGRYATSPFSKFMTWINPFAAAQEAKPEQPSPPPPQQQPQARQHQIAQYAPQQP